MTARSRILLLAGLIAFSIGTSVQAAAPAGDPKDEHPGNSVRQQHLYRSSKIIGTSVRDPKNKRIGEIKDLVLGSGRGEIAYAVVSFGGVWGVGKKFHAIPWQALQPGDDGMYYILAADRETISQAPGFDKANWPDMSDQRWSAEVDRFWGRMVGRGTFGNNTLRPGGVAGQESGSRSSGR